MTEIDQSGRYIVSYIPVEVGVYNITILWNGREVAGNCHFTFVILHLYIKLFAMNKKLLSHKFRSVPGHFFGSSWPDQ